MFSKIRSIFLSLTIIAVLLFSAVGTTTVYADDDTPNDTTTSETRSDDDDDNSGKKKKKKSSEEQQQTAPAESGVSTEGSTTETSSADTTVEGATEETAADAQPSATDEPVVSTEESKTESTSTDANLLAQVPENTTVTVLDAEGQAQSLATQDAANAVATTTDPIWCPAAQTTPTPGANGCTPSFTSFDALLTELANNPTIYQGAGTIYVEQGNYGGGESTIDFNSYNLSNISNANLTIQGGWNPATGSTPAGGDTATTSNFTVPIIIGSSTNPWGGSVTIDNIIVSDSSGTGLTVYSNANVTISDSKFLRNNNAGAVINAGQNVAVSNSDFSNTFNQRRQITGLDITSGGSVSLFQVMANGNRRRGADINAAGRVSIGSNLGCTHTIGTATDCSSFSETNGLNGNVFYGFGLRVVTPDAIDLSFVTANNNFLWGADLDAGGDVNITDSVFNANSTLSPTFIDDTGLLVTSGGRVSLNNVQANDNRLIGAVIDSVGDISVNNSTFTNNRGVILDAAGNTTYHGLGLLAVSQGSIFVNGVNASGNMLFGAHLEAGGDVAVAGSTFSNQTSGLTTVLTGRGLEVVSGGNVFLENVVMDSNQLFGGSIQAVGDVFLDLNTATNNGDDGLQVESASCTHLNGGTYSGNAQFGLNLVNSPLNVVVPATFGGNGAGDISPATPATCSLVVGGIPLPARPTGTNSNNMGPSLGSNYSLSSLVQNVSYTTHTNGTVPSISLNGMFGITRERTSNSVVTSIFVGNYTYVYTAFEDDASIDTLQIIVVNPPPIQIAAAGA
jgi:hypothetical protein